MTIGKMLRTLEDAENYSVERVKISDQFMNMAKSMISDDFDRIREKEETYMKNLKGNQ